MNRTAGVLAIVFTLGIAADALAQRRGQRQQQQQQAVPFTTDEMDKLADLLKRDWPEGKNPEWTAMAAALLKGKGMNGIGGGWFKSPESRYSWKWMRAEFDNNPRDGEIELQELPKGSEAFFKRLDRNQDDAITSKDLLWTSNHVMDVYNPSSEVFQQFDRDSNGRLTKEEMTKFFDRYADGFNYLTPDDLKQGLRFSPPPPPNVQQLQSRMRMPAQQRWYFFKLLLDGELGVIEPGPGIDEDAPDFRLPLLTKDKENHELKLSKERIRLSASKKPVVLIFGSFT